MSTFTTNDKRRMVNAVQARFKLPPDVAKQAAIASADLYGGPQPCDGEYSGFQDACERVGAWFASNVHPVYWDGDAEQLLDSAPEGWTGEDGEWNDPIPVRMLDYPELRTIILGVLGEYCQA